MIIRGEITELKPLTHFNSLEIQGIGSLIKGGFPNPADDFFREAIDLGDVLIKNPDSTFYGFAWSDSMEPLICEGSMILIDISLAGDVRNGSYVVVELEGDLCMKQFWKENGVVTLHSVNKKYSPVVVEEWMDFKIKGKITKIIQSL